MRAAEGIRCSSPSPTFAVAEDWKEKTWTGNFESRPQHVLSRHVMIDDAGVIPANAGSSSMSS